MLSEFGDLYAIELHRESREFAKSRKICPVKEGKLPNDIPFRNNFDLVCLFDVLEHVEKDDLSLSKIFNKMNANGMIVLTVPAFQFLWSEMDSQAHHYRRYNKKKLNTLLIKNGFRVEYSTYFNFFLFPVIGLSIFLYKIFKIKYEANSIFSIPKYLNTILINIFKSESYFLPKICFPFGISLMIIARKD